MHNVFPISVDDVVFKDIEVVTNPNRKPQSIQIIDPEFSSVCPKTGLPDFGRVILQYTPDQHVVELKAWKLYLRCFYGVGMMHEPVTEKIIQDFVGAVEPYFARVMIDWGARGGLKTVTGLEWDRVNDYSTVFDEEPYQKAIADWHNE